jgi:hypothetical protein
MVVATLFDTIQTRSNSDFDAKCATIQFYGNRHNSQSDHWIELTFYMESPDIFSYLRLKFQVNRSSKDILIRVNRGCTNYLLPFDLWTSYLARILFLQGYDSLFWESPSFTRIFNGLQYSFQMWQEFINVSKSFSYKDFFIHRSYNKERKSAIYSPN